MRGDRMAELPVRFRTSLRRHYPHQVQGVSSTFSRTLLDSQPLRLPRTFFLAQNKTDTSEVNDEQIAGRLLWTIYKPAT
jgi:hypothetical protein